MTIWSRLRIGAACLLLSAFPALAQLPPGQGGISTTTVITPNSSATPGTLPARAAHTANLIDDCGALVNTGTDQSAAINACLVTYGRVYAPPGTYTIGHSIVPLTGSALIGSTTGQTEFQLAPNSDGTDIALCANAYSLFGTNVTAGATNSFELANITFDGNSSNQAGSSPATTNGIVCYGQLWNWHDVIVQNVVGAFVHTGFQNTGGGGTASIGFAHFTRLRLNGAGQDGWDFEGPHDSVFNDIDMENPCRSADNTYQGFNNLVTDPSNAIINTIHIYMAGTAPNRCAIGFQSSSGFFNVHHGSFEGMRTQAVLGQGSRLTDSDIFSQFPYNSNTGTCQVTMVSNESMVANTRFRGWPTGSAQQRNMYGLCIGDPVLGGASGLQLLGNSFQDYDLAGAIYYQNASTGNNVITGYGTTSGSGTAAAIVGTIPSTDTIFFSQGGTDPSSITQIGQRATPAFTVYSANGSYTIPPYATTLCFYVLGGGSSGGNGIQLASGTASSGGAGGSAGGWKPTVCHPASEFSSPVAITVGAATGNPAGSGTAGIAGNKSCFSATYCEYGGGSSAGGGSGISSASGATGHASSVGNAASGATPGAANGQVMLAGSTVAGSTGLYAASGGGSSPSAGAGGLAEFGASGGGAAGGMAATPASLSGAAGGISGSVSGGAAGATGANGSAATCPGTGPGPGGGGGGNGVGVTAGNGAAGCPGAGGGGGGSSEGAAVQFGIGGSGGRGEVGVAAF
jgi:hypothetical protein